MNNEVLLKRIFDELNLVNKKLDAMIELYEKLLKAHEKLFRRNQKRAFVDTKLELDTMTLLSLPMSLRKTVMALYKLEKATAEEIAKETKRLRAVESAAANQLVRMGYLKKNRKGRTVYFYIEPPLEIKK